MSQFLQALASADLDTLRTIGAALRVTMPSLLIVATIGPPSFAYVCGRTIDVICDQEIERQKVGINTSRTTSRRIAR